MATRPFTRNDAQLMIELARLTELVEQVVLEALDGERLLSMTAGNCAVIRAILAGRGYTECATCGACMFNAKNKDCDCCTGDVKDADAADDTDPDDYKLCTDCGCYTASVHCHNCGSMARP